MKSVARATPMVIAGVLMGQNTKNLRSAAIQASHDALARSLMALSVDPTAAETLHKGMRDFDALDPQEKMRFTNLVTAFMLTFQNSYFQYSEGTLPEYIWKQQRSLARWWAGRRGVGSAFAAVRHGIFHRDFLASLDLPQSEDAPDDSGPAA